MAELVYMDSRDKLENIIRYVEQEWSLQMRWLLQDSLDGESCVIIRAPKEKLLRFKLLCPHQAKQVRFYESAAD
jgi:hypothetical protein